MLPKVLRPNLLVVMVHPLFVEVLVGLFPAERVDLQISTRNFTRRNSAYLSLSRFIGKARRKLVWKRMYDFFEPSWRLSFFDIREKV